MTSQRSPLDLIRGTATHAVDLETQAFLDRVGRIPSTLADHRACLTPSRGANPENYSVDVVRLVPPAAVCDDGPLRLLRPRGSTRRLPLFFYHHGGGWSDGKPHSHDRWLYQLAAGADIAVASIDDALAETTPVAERVDRAAALMRWLLETAADIGVDPDRVLIGGDGMGGHMAATLAIAAARRRSGLPRALVLVCPLIDGSCDAASHQAFEGGPWLSAEVVRAMLGALAVEAGGDQFVPPSTAASRQLERMPPTTIITAECDPLRDEGEDFARRLMRSGVTVSATRYLGTIHNFPVIDALCDSASAIAATAQVIEALGLIGNEPQELDDGVWR